MKGNRQMAQTRWFRAFGLAAFTLMASLSLAAQGDLAAIQQKLSTQFTVTRTTADRSDIVTAGDMVTIQKPGLVMFAGTAVPSTNNYKNGIIGQGFGTALIMANPNTLQRTFVPEERCWITGIQVQKDGVLFHLFSRPYNGISYYGDLKVLFPAKKVVPDVDSFMQTIAEVLTVDDQGYRSRGRGRPGPGQPAPAYAPDAAPEPMPDLAPPPTPPPTIEAGQTTDQVTAAFGQPLRVAKFGVKEIYFYKEMKVTFTNGIVSNIE
jgi:hypothetical protein